MTADVAKDHNVALPQGGDQHLLDIGIENPAIDRHVDHPGGCERVMAQGCDEGHGVRMPERCMSDQPLAARSPASQRVHFGLCPCFINEDKPLEINNALMGLPPQALVCKVLPVLFTRQSGFF